MMFGNAASKAIRHTVFTDGICRLGRLYPAFSVYRCKMGGIQSKRQDGAPRCALNES